MPPDLIYLARGRPQRPRANLIQTLHTVEALSAAGVGTRLYLPSVPGSFDLPGFLAGMGIRHPIDLRCRASLNRRWAGWPFVLLHRKELLGAKVVYTRVPELSQLLARNGIPHFLEVHDTETLVGKGLAPALLKAAQSGVLRGLIAISEAGRAALVDLGFAAERLGVLPSGVDLGAFSTIPIPGIEDFRAARAIYVGRISRDRGLDLLEAVAAAGHPVTLVGPRDDEPTVRSENLKIEGTVPHAQVPACLARAAVALMPYQAHLQHAATISPIKLFEAMAAGRLVVASDLPPIREVVRHGENGLLVDPDDPAAWIAAMAQVRANPEAALALAEAGRATARDYGWDTRAQRLLALTGLRAA
ncbi:glycosyltransferase family 4 protein [Azoarcus sp. KH32C]|uniref:glycosyltransferase family 4 protein n=1 Tax=Azoarcus sp. KH32C TaxID=748247 RepID=UPI0002385FAE|nr:glycosyltransferase family 4 protein [Azoarcus sp. KH32C]BAL22943.1 glycosyltransferase family protein [Azoarcus sp. KH32C]